MTEYKYAEHMLNGVLHREDGPAIEYANGTKHWYLNGKKHRKDGPASENYDGDKRWFLNGFYHRIDGPAIIYANGEKEWIISDTRASESIWDRKDLALKYKLLLKLIHFVRPT